MFSPKLKELRMILNLGDIRSVGAQTIAYSSNGFNWTAVTSFTFTVEGSVVIFSALQRRFFVVGTGTSGTIATSRDGIIWTPQNDLTLVSIFGVETKALTCGGLPNCFCAPLLRCDIVGSVTISNSMNISTSMSVEGNATFLVTASVLLQALSISSQPLMSVSGTAALDGTLAVVVPSSLPPSTSLVLLQGQSLFGQFRSLQLSTTDPCSQVVHLQIVQFILPPPCP